MAINRALTIATVGLLAASPLTLATDGFIQTGFVTPPVIVTPVQPPSGGAFVYRQLKKAVKHLVSDHIQLVYNLDDTVTGFHVSKRFHGNVTFIDVTVIGDDVTYKASLGEVTVTPTLLLKDNTLASLAVITTQSPVGSVYFTDSSYVEAVLSGFKLHGDTLNINQAFQPSDTVTFVPAPIIDVLDGKIKDSHLFIVQLDEDVQYGTVVPEQYFASDTYKVAVLFEQVGFKAVTASRSEKEVRNIVELKVVIDHIVRVDKAINNDEVLALLLAGIIAGDDF